MHLLQKKKIRTTPFRLKVLEAFTSHENALTLGQIEQYIGDHDRITLYRTLKTFEEKGLIHEIVIGGEMKKMALCSDGCGDQDHDHNHQHIHFLCTNCKEVFCIDYHLPEIKIPGFTVENIEVQGQGLCANCK